MKLLSLSKTLSFFFFKEIYCIYLKSDREGKGTFQVVTATRAGPVWAVSTPITWSSNRTLLGLSCFSGQNIRRVNMEAKHAGCDPALVQFAGVIASSLTC